MNCQNAQMLAVIDDTLAWFAGHPERRAVTPDGECFYRLLKDDGTLACCAIGRFIPDDRYSPSLEKLSVVELIIRRRLSDELEGLSPLFLKTLQNLHDLSACWRRDGQLSETGKQFVEEFKACIRQDRCENFASLP